MNDAKRAQLIERIKTMRDATGRTEEEAEAFIAKAAALVMEHQLDEKEIDGHGRQAPGRHEANYWFGNSSQGVFTLASAAAEAFGCVGIGYVGRLWNGKARRNMNGAKVVFFGRPDDLTLYVEFFEGVLIPQMISAVSKARPRSRASFCNAWALTVADRLREVRYRVAEDAGQALVAINVDPEVRDAADAEIDAPPSIPTMGDRDSIAAGASAGETADIGGAKLTNNNPTNPLPTTPRQIGTGQ